MKPLKVSECSFGGLNLVEAGAGTGKTYNITCLYVRAILEQHLLPKNILVLTYTEAATAELRSRIRSRILECIEALKGHSDKPDEFLNQIQQTYNKSDINHLKNALFSFDEAAVFTIHGFCQKLLREQSLAFGVQPDFQIIKDNFELVQDSVDDYWRDIVSEYSASEVMRSFLNYLIEEKINPDTLKVLVEELISKPYAKVLPGKLSEEEFRAGTEEIAEALSDIRSRWNNDKDDLKDVIFGGELNRVSYKPEAFKVFWEELISWIESPHVYFSGFNKLEHFGKSKIERAAKKNSRVDAPPICELIDTYLLKIRTSETLKGNFLIQATEEIQVRINEKKNKNGVLGFDDLLQIVETNLTGSLSKQISSQYPVALVDEFQDTDPIQYSIFRQIYSKTKASLFMIGDPKQAIYSFRGADLFTYFKATKDVDAANRFSLDKNYRSSKSLIEAVNVLFNRHNDPFVFEVPEFRNGEYPEKKETPEFLKDGIAQIPFSFIDCNADQKNMDELRTIVCEYVAKQVSTLLHQNYSIGEEKVKPGDIAILVRKKSEANLVKRVLKKFGIRGAMQSNESMYSTLVCEELKLILKAIADTGNHDLIRTALATTLIGFAGADIINLNTDEGKWGKILAVFHEAGEEWKTKGILVAFNKLDSFFGISLNLSKLQDADRMLTDLAHLQELLAAEERKRRLLPNGLIRFLYRKINSDVTPEDEERIRLESDNELVTINTLHSSKGLEYPITFIPFIWDSFDTSYNWGLKSLQYHNKQGNLLIDVAPKYNKEGREQAVKEELGDAMRLLYVALTRAKSACFVPFVRYKSLNRSTMGALLCGTDAVLNRSPDIGTQTISELESIAGSNRNIIHHTAADLDLTEEVVSFHDSFDEVKLCVNSFSRNDLNRFSRTVSFSSLIKGAESSESGKDYDFEMASSSFDGENETYSAFSFPKGAGVGTLIHNIFELIDFKEPAGLADIVYTQLEKAGINHKWQAFLKQWVADCLEHKLFGEFSLSKLEPAKVLKEMEFHFPIKGISLDNLLSIVRGSKYTKQVPAVEINGFMKGFIDLIFEHNGKFYILDYKSNYLGDASADYTVEKLTDKIRSSRFDLQYHIYVVALKKYLSQRIPDFDYNTQFGGVIYFFIRGIEKGGAGSGVFFDCPKKEVIESIEQAMEVKANV